MKGVCLTFFTYEFQKHHGILMHEWLLEFAKKNGVPGGIALKALAGYGRHGKLHEEHFFELASNVPIKIIFVMKKSESDHFLELIKSENINLFYTQSPIEFGYTNTIS